MKRHCLIIAASLFLSVIVPASAQTPAQIPEDFPHFIVPGHEHEMELLRDLHWLHYKDCGPMATLWDEWLSMATQWQAVSTDNRLNSMRDRWRAALAARIMDPDGYVATHQHNSIAHQLGWPFPWYGLAGEEGWGWPFSIQGFPSADWTSNATSKPANAWVVTGAKAGAVTPDGWHLELTAPLSTLEPPPPITISVQQAPFLQIRWRARGFLDAQPYVEWKQQGQSDFQPSQRMYFDPIDSDNLTITMIPLYRNPAWSGRITALRLALGNARPGASIIIHSIFTQYDTRHDINNQNFIKGLLNTFDSTHDLNFLRAQINRARLALRWLMTDMGSLDENMIIARFVGHEGVSGVDLSSGSKVIRRGYGIGSNYWDVLPGGYQDAYATVYYYDALRAMARAEREIRNHPEWNIPGGPLRFDPAPLEAHAAQVKETFQKEFWNPRTSRFHLGRDARGHIHDYGYTFMNFDAMYYDLASPEQARDILDWITGKRVVEGDTSSGADLYHFRFAARESTKRNIDWYGWYWANPETVAFGDQVQDGGAVLAWSYEDLMSRLRWLGADNAWARLREIIAWYGEVQSEGGYRAYYSKPGRGTMQGAGVPGGLGLDKEFFESILVPQVMLRGFLGFSFTAEGFRLDPRLPSDWPELTIDHIAMNDLVLKIKATKDTIEVNKEGLPRHACSLQLPHGSWQLAYIDSAGKPLATIVLRTDVPSIDLDWKDAAGIRLTKIESTSQAQSPEHAAVPAKIASFEGPYRFLSNFWPATVEFEGITYPTVEHAYQSAKTLDLAERRRIAAIPSPGAAKTAGRALQLRPDWPTEKFIVMEKCVRYKFTYHPDLREKLLATGDAPLEEGNTWNDQIWGVYQGQGENRLGKLLMQIRAELRADHAPLNSSEKRY